MKIKLFLLGISLTVAFFTASSCNKSEATQEVTIAAEKIRASVPIRVCDPPADKKTKLGHAGGTCRAIDKK